MQEDCTTVELMSPSTPLIDAMLDDIPLALTCSLQEATILTGLSYGYLMGQSKLANPKDRLPGFRPNKSTFRVIVAELPTWLNRKAGLA